jgi:hypothetical protein
MLLHLDEKDTYLGSQKDGLHVTLFFFLSKGGMLFEETREGWRKGYCKEDQHTQSNISVVAPKGSS